MTDLVQKRCESEAEARAEVLQALLNERHSCRGFQQQPVPRATVDRILAMAQRTASWCNSQAWQVHVFSEGATQRARGVYGAIDCGAYVGNLMLAAYSLGVGSIAMAAQAAQSHFWRGRLQVEDGPQHRLRHRLRV